MATHEKNKNEDKKTAAGNKQSGTKSQSSSNKTSGDKDKNKKK